MTDADEMDEQIERAAELRSKRGPGGDRGDPDAGGRVPGTDNLIDCPLGCGAEVMSLPGHLPDCPER